MQKFGSIKNEFIEKMNSWLKEELCDEDLQEMKAAGVIACVEGYRSAFIANMNVELEALFSGGIRSAFNDRDRLLESLKSLVEYDTHDTEYDGRVHAICPSCGEQDGNHGDRFDFTAARKLISRLEK